MVAGCVVVAGCARRPRGVVPGGCAGFVVKPIRWQALVDVVRRYLPE